MKTYVLMCIIHLDNHAIDYMSQYVGWIATPVSMWIYGNVWECEWKWRVDKVVVISISVIRLVHTQIFFSVSNRTVFSFLMFDTPGILCVYV